MSSLQPLQDALHGIGDDEQRTPFFVLSDVFPFVSSKQGLAFLTLSDHHMSEGDGGIGQLRQYLADTCASWTKRNLQNTTENADRCSQQNGDDASTDPQCSDWRCPDVLEDCCNEIHLFTYSPIHLFTFSPLLMNGFESGQTRPRTERYH